MLKVNIVALPLSTVVRTLAVTHETSRGSREAMVRSSMRTSRVNSNPANGALNTPAMAPDAPHPMSSINVFWSTLKNLPKVEPIAEPVRTIGDSAPTEPPNPMVMELATTLDQQLCALICP